VHHHFAPPGYSSALRALMRNHAKWSVQGTLEEMDKSGIATCFTSLINPGMQAWDNDLPGARKIARISNEYAAQLMRDHPGRFGSFASIPFPDIEASLREIEYAYDVLKADGIYLWTSYNGKLLGDPATFPILEELNRRKAVVYTHPATPACCAQIMPYISINAIEGPVDTTRTMVSLLFQGGAAKYPDIRWIFSHSGGVTPFLLSRYQREEVEKDRKAVLPRGVMHELRKFYYDTAQGHHDGALKALLAIIPPSQVLYGTDYPFWDGRKVSEGLAKGGFSAAERMAVDRDNALRLFPRLRA
jgi:predicted TIM-barrel fold metal-dependent hydrolase